SIAVPQRRSRLPWVLGGSLMLAAVALVGLKLRPAQVEPMAVVPPPPLRVETAPAPAPSPPANGTLTLSSSTACELTIDGKAGGRAPQQVALAAGDHHVACKNAFGAESAADVTLAAGEKSELSIKFKTG